MSDMFTGALIIACTAVGLFFIRFWTKTRDRFFLMFALAFWVLALNWVGLAVTGPEYELRTYFYVIRLVSFVLILIAILDKNRPRRQRATSRDGRR